MLSDGPTPTILALLKQIWNRRDRAKSSSVVMTLVFIGLWGYNYGISQSIIFAADARAAKILESRPLEVEIASGTAGENSSARQTDSEAGANNVVGHAPTGNTTQNRPALGGVEGSVETSNLDIYCGKYLTFGGSSEVRYSTLFEVYIEYICVLVISKMR